jgi:ABC-type uncharacterized transport system auxiliary subunit
MSRTTSLLLIVGLLGLGFAVASCGALSKPYPEKSFFAIDAGPTPAATQALREGALRVRRLRVAKPYDGLTFVYKTGGSEFRTDYYHGFIAAPEVLLTSETIRWLSAAGPFASVVDGASSAPNRYVLDGNVTALCGDMTDAQAPKAVLEVRFFLLDESGAEAAVKFQKAYAATVPAAGARPDDLVDAWGKAMGQILTALAADLAKADLR